MTDPSHDPAPPPASPPPQPPPPPAETFTVTFAGPPSRNTMRLEGEGELTFEGGDVLVEAQQFPDSAPPRPVRFMFAEGEIARVGLHEGALVLAIRPAAQPSRIDYLSFFVSSEADARRLMGRLHPPAAAESGAEASAINRFYARLRRASTVGTQALLAANIAVFALMTLTGVSLLDPDFESLLRWGARFNPLIEQGQWWRIATPMFIHIGLLHLVFNMWALRALGDFVERLYGTGRFLVIYFAAGLVGFVASYFNTPEGIAAGASGAIFGILGALVAFIFRRRHVIPRQILVSLRSNAFSMIALNLVLGFSIKAIDNSAHLGGLAGGLLLGWLLAPRPAETLPPEPDARRQRIYAGIFAALLVGLILLARQASTPEQLNRLFVQHVAISKVSAQLKNKLGDAAPVCESVTLHKEQPKGRYTGSARLSDGRTVDVVVIDRDDHVEVTLPG